MFFMSTINNTLHAINTFQLKNSMMQRRERGKRQLSQTIITPLIIILASILLLYFIICIDVFFPFPKDFYYWLAATL